MIYQIFPSNSAVRDMKSSGFTGFEPGSSGTYGCQAASAYYQPNVGFEDSISTLAAVKGCFGFEQLCPPNHIRHL